jgi:hypothetical protein
VMMGAGGEFEDGRRGLEDRVNIDWWGESGEVGELGDETESTTSSMS